MSDSKETCLYEMVAGTSAENQNYRAWMEEFEHKHPTLFDAAAKAAGLLTAALAEAPAPANKLCDPNALWYAVGKLVLNGIKPANTWWVAQYIAPFDSRVATLGTVVLMREDGRILVARRSDDMPDKPGTWGFPGGNSDRLPGEGNRLQTFAETALSELASEVGVDLTEGQIGRLQHMIEVRSNVGGEFGREQKQAVWVVVVNDETADTVRPLDETKAVAWAATADIGKPGETLYGLGFYDIDRAIVAAAEIAYQRYQMLLAHKTVEAKIATKMGLLKHKLKFTSMENQVIAARVLELIDLLHEQQDRSDSLREWAW